MPAPLIAAGAAAAGAAVRAGASWLIKKLGQKGIKNARKNLSEKDKRRAEIERRNKPFREREERAQAERDRIRAERDAIAEKYRPKPPKQKMTEDEKLAVLGGGVAIGTTGLAATNTALHHRSINRVFEAKDRKEAIEKRKARLKIIADRKEKLKNVRGKISRKELGE